MASSDFCTSVIRAEVAEITSLNSASTAASLLTTTAWVRAALVSVSPIQRTAAWTRACISWATASDRAWTWAER